MNNTLRSFNASSVSQVPIDMVKEGHVILFKDHRPGNTDAKEQLGIVYKRITDQQGNNKGQTTAMIILPLTPISMREYNESTPEERKQRYDGRTGVRITRNPKVEDLRSLSVNVNHKYCIGYNVQLPGHKDIPDKDRLRVVSVTPETVCLGDNGAVKILGKCGTHLWNDIETKMTGSFEIKGRANAVLHAIFEKTKLTRVLTAPKLDKREPK